MRILKAALSSFGVWCLLAGTASAQVHLTIANGRVTLVAKDATVPQILAEWGRVGRTQIVNGERVTGGPVTIELHDVPEAEALGIILRSVSGYMAAWRETPVATASLFDRIMVMPTSTAPPPAPVRTTGNMPTPVFPQPGFPQRGQAPQVRMPMGVPGDDEEEGGAMPGRPPVFNSYPPAPGMPQQVAPGVVPAQGPLVLPQPGGSEGQGTMPTGASQPGMIVQPPQPNQPRRPGGPGGADL